MTIYGDAVDVIFRSLDFGTPGGITAPQGSRVPLSVVVDHVEEEVQVFQGRSRSLGYTGYIKVVDHPTKPVQNSIVDEEGYEYDFRVRNSWLDSTETYWELDLDPVRLPPAPSRMAHMPAPGILTWPVGIVENEVTP